jgi:uncharacterized protein with ParB-like and HNH nuclease domain
MIFAQSNMKKYLYTPGTFFEIPEFQRPYSWQSTNIDEFLLDIEECIAKNKKHYFGTVVEVEDTDSVYSKAIIDGQQRVTTSLLMVAAIYHLAKKNPQLLENPETTADKIEFQFLINKDLDNNRVKLRTVTSDNEILQRIFDARGEESELSLNDRQSNVYKAYAKFRDYFSKKTGLDKYINDGLGQFEIAVLTLVSGDDNPQRVFESINSTGKPLSDGDKIRNFALMLKKGLSDYVYQEYWRPIERTLTDTNQDYITDFFRYYLISKKQTRLQLPEVYTEFKKQFERHVGEEQEKAAIDKFYADIKRSLKFYELLKLTDTNKIKDTPEFAKYGALAETIFRMRYLRVDLYIPYGISVLGYHADGQLTDDELTEVFSLIEAYFSRRVVVNFYVTSVDRFMGSLHKQVLDFMRRDANANYVEVLKYVILSQTGQTQIPNESDFETAVRTFPFYEQHGNAVLCYVLASTEDGSKDDSKQTLHKIAEDGLQLTIEHVMPQTLTAREWKEMLGEEYDRIHGEYLHTLANLTLTGYNSEYSNLPYIGTPGKDKMTLEVKDKKTGVMRKVGFKDSPLQINKWIAEHIKWDETTLKERQEWWLKKLNEIWPLPKTSFQPIEEDTAIFLLDEIDLKGKGIKSVEVFGKKDSVSTWADAVDIIVEAIYENNPDNFLEAVNSDEWLSKYIQRDATAFGGSREIYETGYFVDTGTNTNAKRQLIVNLANALNLPHDSIRVDIKDYLTAESEDE